MRGTVEVVYLITSADHLAASPETVASWVQGHWAIENRLHWVRDVTFGEEGLSQVRTGQAPRVMASCRNIGSVSYAWRGGTTPLRVCVTMPDIPIRRSRWR